MADNNTIETPITPSSLPTQSTEILYGPQLLPQEDVPTYKDIPPPVSTPSYFNGIGGQSDFYSNFEKDFYKSAQQQDYLKLAAPLPFNAEATLFDKFQSSWDFADKGFIPTRDNDEIYNQDTNVLKELYRSSKWAAPLLADGFISGARTFPDLIAGVFTGDMDRLIQSDDYLAEKWSRATKMGASTAGGMSGFLTNFEISAANMVGMATEIIIEDAIIGAITAYSGGATAPLAAVQAGRTASVFKNIYEGLKNVTKVVDIFKDANTARRLWEVSLNGIGKGAASLGKGTFNFLNPLRQTVGGFGHGGFFKDLYRGEEYLKGTGALGKTVQGFGAFYRDLREVNFALTEAKLEGGFSYLERKEEMVNDYVAKNGRLPQGEEAQAIERNARDGGDSVTIANMPIIYYSNRFGFGNLFKGFKPLDKLLAETGAGDSLFKNIRFNNAKKIFEEVKDFSVKRAFRTGLGNSLNYFKANYMEGIQENLQDVIQGAAKDYYDQKFKTPSYGGFSVMMADVASQFGKKVFTAQGAETFASGALMGLVMQGGMRGISGVQNLTYRLTNKEGYQEFKKLRQEQIDKYVTQLNEIYTDPLKYLDPQFMNAVRQGELSKYLSQAVINQNKKQFYDIKDQAVYEHLWTLVRSGKTDIFKDKIQELKQLKPEEFEDALGFKIDNPQEFQSYLDDQEKKLDQIQRLYDKSIDKIKNPVNLAAFKKDTPEYEKAAKQYLAFENARQQAVFANYSFIRNAERMTTLLSEMKKVKLMGKSNYLDLSILTDPVLLANEVRTLQKEIQSLSQGDAESVKLAKEKEKRLKAIEVWYGTINSPQLEKNIVAAINKQDILLQEGQPTKPLFPADYPSAENPAYENWRRAAKFAFEKLMTTEAEINKDSLYRDGVNEVFDQIMDYHTLNRESKGMLEMINILADPNNFLKLYDGHFKIIRDLVEKRVTVLRDAVFRALNVTDEINLANILIRNNFVEDPENPGTYYKIINFRTSNFSPVEPGSEDALKIEEIVKDYKEAIKPEEPAATSTPTTPYGTPTGPEVVTATPATPVSDIEAKKALGQELISIVWERFAKQGITNADSIVGTRDTIENVDFDKFWSNVTKEDLQNLKKQYETNKKEQLELYNKFKGAFDPSTGTITSDDTSFFDNKIKLVDAELAALEGAKPVATTTPAFSDILDKLDKSNTIEELVEFENYTVPGTPEFNSLTPEQRTTLNKLLLEKNTKIIEALSAAPTPSPIPSKEVKLEKTDPRFISAYNKAVKTVKEALEKPINTEDDIRKIVDGNFGSVIAMLKDPIVKQEYRQRIKEKKDKLIQDFRNNSVSKDITALKKKIDDIFTANENIEDIENALVRLFETSVSASLKEQALEHTMKLYNKKFDAAAVKTVEEPGAELDEITKKYISYIDTYSAKIQKLLDKYSKQAEELGEKAQGIDLAVKYDESYENSTHYSISNSDWAEKYNATSAQLLAISNLIKTGILLESEIPSMMSIADASAEVNKGVARIYTIGINKGILEYLKKGKLDLLKSEYEAYQLAALQSLDKTKEEVLEDVNDKLERIKSEKLEDFGEILSILGIDETLEISDEIFKLLKEFRSIVYKMQTEADLIDKLNILKNKKNDLISSGDKFTSLEEFLDEKMVQDIVGKLLQKEKGEKVDITPFYNELLDLIENADTAKTAKEVEDQISKIAKKYAYKSKVFDLAGIMRSFVGIVMDAKITLASENVEEEANTELTEEEMLRIINGEKRVLSPNQLAQLEEYKKELGELLKDKYSSAPSYEEIKLEFDEEEIAEPEKESLKFLALRQKDAADVRTMDELTAEYNVVDNKINIRFALDKIIDSDFSTEAEKQLATSLKQVIAADATMDVENTIASAGRFDPETERASVNLSAVGYKEDKPSNPIETVILHELLHTQIERGMQDAKGTFKTAIKSLYAAAKSQPNASSFYAMQSMSEDEQLREFVIEAFTNPAFQHFLAKIPYAKSGKSIWQKFVDILNNLLKSIGIDVEGTVLNEVINQTTELIKFDYTEKLLTRLSEANTSDDISQLKSEINVEGTILRDDILQSANSVLDRKLKSIKDKENLEKLKEYSKINIGGKTYYYKLTDNDTIELNKLYQGRIVRVKDAGIIEKFIKAIINEVGIKKAFGEQNIDALTYLIGDPSVQGTYASGQMPDTPIDEGPLRNAIRASVVFKFQDLDEFNRFRKEYWKYKKRDRGAKSLEEIKSMFPGRGVTSFIEIIEGLGGLNTGKNKKNLTDIKIDRLIRMNAVKINLKGLTHEDYVNDEENPTSFEDFVEVYQLMLDGVPLSTSQRDLIEKQINKTIGKIFGKADVSPELQRFVEDKLRDVEMPYEFDEEEPPFTPEEAFKEEPEEKPTEEDEVAIKRREVVHKKKSTPADFDASTIDPKKAVTAKQTYALRSYSVDLINNEETPDFKAYYHKIRSIINILSVKPLDQLGDVFITLAKDDANLRWDGSADDVWAGKTKGVLGYLSDKDGNPHVFDKQGNIVGTILKSNLADKKGLDNGDNQIVYFTTFKEDSASKLFKGLDEESKQKLIEARRKVMSGVDQIANLVRISPGIFNNRALVNSNAASQARTDKTDEANRMFLQMLMQPNVSFEFNNKGDLLALIKDESGAVNRIGLFPPNTENVLFKKETDPPIALFDYMIKLMAVYHKMNLAGDKDINMVRDKLDTFVKNMWFTGKKTKLVIAGTMASVGTRDSLKEPFKYYNIFNKVTGEPIMENIAEVKKFMDKLHININKRWFNKSVKFEFPYINNKTGKLNFVEYDYQKFLFEKVGLSSNTVEIKSQEELRRYNSMIVFTETRDITEKAPDPTAEITKDDLIKDESAIVKKTNEVVNNPTPVKKEPTVDDAKIEAVKNRMKRKFEAPSYDQIFEKICK